MELPKINREDVDFSSDTEICNVGYLEGVYEDRPYRIEVWSSYGIDVATIFISKENLKETDVRNYLTNANLIDIKEDKIKIEDFENEGNMFYSINVPLKDRGNIYNELKVELDPYDI